MALAKVRPNNNYGGNAPEGTLLEVADAELDRVPWCLERVADDPPQGAAEMDLDADRAEADAEAAEDAAEHAPGDEALAAEAKSKAEVAAEKKAARAAAKAAKRAQG